MREGISGIVHSNFGALGNNVKIDPQTILYQIDKIYLADNVEIKRDVTLNAIHKVEGIQLGQEGIYIGKNSRIHPFALLESAGGYIKIGEDVSIKEFCLIYGTGGVEIGNYVRIAAHTSIVAENHRFDDNAVPIYQQGITVKGIKIGDDVLIGVNSVILDGVTIGSGSVIGAGSVVTRNVPEFSVAMGNPAKLRRKRN